ncbi:L,D-transpeptidase family protein [Ovoidimarina sediminis]|uniref:L,D-transpeptidase family protein n=1 Tax=Ovoidimarina sediminis TaxID=3079856 RepID=UPI002909068A|nr:L,D-transpeptidase family protein [Rhodophyticola sp. MJ-SS7]MDU8945505.1 L,D-transpeptidase family protein [Rhodophyticola sp. MJ-SS7]
MGRRLIAICKIFSSLVRSIVSISILLAGFARADALQDEIAREIAAIEAGEMKVIGGVRLTSLDFVSELYSLRDHMPLWSNALHSEDLVRELLGARRHGFQQRDFSISSLLELRRLANEGPAAAQARFDIAATEVAARLLHHVYLGKVDPLSLDPTWSFGRAFVPANAAAMVNEYLEVASFGALVDDIEINHPAYLALQEALDLYLSIEARGGWPAVPEGKTLRYGDKDERIAILRKRLAATGDYTSVPSEMQVFDDELLASVQAFQARHGLEVDGVVGPKTFRALNQTVMERIDQLRASLERARWLFRDLGNDYVFVNIGGPEAQFVQNGKTVWKARAIVGQAFRQTPVFRDEIEYMEFNPTWTVPRSIFLKDKLPLIRRDPGYLARGGFTVLDAKGRPISPNFVDWAGTPNITLRQRPGPKNALGQVKFMFPNAHSVYLHDTDDRSLFDRAERNLSSGCVRIEKPFELADLLMKDDPDWSATRRAAILAIGSTTRVRLPKPVPILLTYFTAWMDEERVVQFREDLYGRDARILAALDAEFRG